MTRLSVNINKIATIRNARGGKMPDVTAAAVNCERFGAEGIHDLPDLIWIINLKHQLSGGFHAGIAVEGQIEGFFEELGKDIGEFPALRNDFDAVTLEGIAEEQNAEAFRQSAAVSVGENPADLCLGRCREGNSHAQASFS